MNSNKAITIKKRNGNKEVIMNYDFFLMLSCIDERFKILDYLLKNQSGEYCIATQKNISENTNISLPRVRNFLKTLENNKFLIKHSQGVYKLTIPMEKIS